MSAFATAISPYPIETSSFHTKFCIQALHVSIAVANCESPKYLCNSLITLLTTSWRNLNKIEWSELYTEFWFFHKKPFKGTQMGVLVLVCPYFRKNVIITCEIVSFLCSLDKFLLKNVIVFFFLFFGNLISKWRSFEKGLFFTYFSHFFVTREKKQKILQHKSHQHT